MRRFLQGLGLGLLVAALVMGISYRGSSSSAGEDIIEKARELGMVFPQGTKTPDETEVETEDSDTADVDAEAASGTSAKGAGAGEDTADDKAEKSEAATATPQATKKPQATKVPKDLASASPDGIVTATPLSTPVPVKPENGQTVKFTVESGLLSSSVARELKNAGIIDDDKAFDRYLVENDLGRRVIAGTYEIKAGSSYETIAKIITHT